MATTTNFGWETPDDTDLVKDGAAAIRTALGGVDTSFVDLKGGTTGQVLSKATNTDLDFTWVTQDDANAIQNAIVDAKGDIITATAADTPARLAVGTNGHVLTADSTTATGLKWAAAAGGGKVLQVVSATYSTTTTIASTTFTDSGLSVSITPSATTSKILVIVSQPTTVSRGAIGYGGVTQLVRGSTVVYKQGDTYGTLETNSGSRLGAVIPMVYLDSPSTTSATTYKTQGRAYDTSSSGQIQFQNDSGTASIVVMEIGA